MNEENRYLTALKSLAHTLPKRRILVSQKTLAYPNPNHIK